MVKTKHPRNKISCSNILYLSMWCWIGVWVLGFALALPLVLALCVGATGTGTLALAANSFLAQCVYLFLQSLCLWFCFFWFLRFHDSTFSFSQSPQNPTWISRIPDFDRIVSFSFHGDRTSRCCGNCQSEATDLRKWFGLVYCPAQVRRIGKLVYFYCNISCLHV